MLFVQIVVYNGLLTYIHAYMHTYMHTYTQIYIDIHTFIVVLMGCFLLALLKNERKQEMGASGPAVRGMKRTRTLAEAVEAGGAGAQELNDSIDIQNNISEMHSEARNILVNMSSKIALS